jgi:poly(A) polymerase
MHSEDYITKKIDLNNRIEFYITHLISRLQKSGYDAYLVGGAIRDILLNRIPKDYDVATSATPEQVRRTFGRRRARVIGRRFKIVHLYCGSDIIEISTFRKKPRDNSLDSKNTDDTNSNLIFSDNEYGTAYEDAWRRDFTVNSLFYDPVRKIIIDFTSKGIKDLKKGIARVIGDADTRFSEDPVRLLRALKLVGQYDFTLSKKTEISLNKSIKQILLASNSRLTLELEKILKSPYAYGIIKAFQKYGFLDYYLPNLSKCKDTAEFENALNLFKIRCNLLKEGDTINNLSLALAVIVMPFVNTQLSGAPDTCIFSFNPDARRIIKQTVNDIFAPYFFPKYIVSAVADSILLQNRIYKRMNPSKTKRHPNFKIARELSVILNNYWWKDDTIVDFWRYNKQRNK